MSQDDKLNESPSFSSLLENFTIPGVNSTVPAPPKKLYYVSFAGSVNQANFPTIQAVLTSAIHEGWDEVHFLLHSNGGFVDEGIALNQLLKTYSLPITIYNRSSVASCAAVGYLGAPSRKVSSHGTFMFHTPYMPSLLNKRASELLAVAKNLQLGEVRTENIMRERLTLTDAEWSLFHSGEEVQFSAEDALRCGIVDEILDWAPPLGVKPYYIPNKD